MTPKTIRVNPGRFGVFPSAAMLLFLGFLFIQELPRLPPPEIVALFVVGAILSFLLMWIFWHYGWHEWSFDPAGIRYSNASKSTTMAWKNVEAAFVGRKTVILRSGEKRLAVRLDLMSPQDADARATLNEYLGHAFDLEYGPADVARRREVKPTHHWPIVDALRDQYHWWVDRRLGYTSAQAAKSPVSCRGLCSHDHDACGVIANAATFLPQISDALAAARRGLS